MPSAPPRTEITIVRHGETDWNVRLIIQGHLDSALTARGEAQAQALVQRFHDVSLTSVVSSDLGRAQQTAVSVAHDHGLSLKTSTMLREKYLGKFQGRPVDELRAAYPNWDHVPDAENHHFKLYDDEESNLEVVERVLQFLLETARENPGGAVLVVTHGGPIRYLLVHHGYGSYASVRRIPNIACITAQSDGRSLTVVGTAGMTPENSGPDAKGMAL